MALYDQLSPAEIQFYQRALQAIQDSLNLRDDSLPGEVKRQKRILTSWKIKGEQEQQFVFYAIGFRYFAHEQIQEILDGLQDGPVEKALKKQWETYLFLLHQITAILISGRYPDFKHFAYLIWMQSCVEATEKDSPLVGFHRLATPGQYLKLYAVRWWAKKVQKNLDQIISLVPAEIERYPNFVQLTAFNHFQRDCLAELKRKLIVPLEDADKRKARLNNRAAVNQYVDKIKSYAPILNLIEHKDYQNYAFRLQRLMDQLGTDDLNLALDFAKDLDRIFRRIERDHRRAVRRTLENLQTLTTQVQNYIYKLEKELKSAEKTEVFNRYRHWLQSVNQQLKNSDIDELSIRKIPQYKSQVGPFLFDRDRVLAAVYSEALNVDRFAEEEAHLPWSDLPAHVAVQIYRDMISREQFDHLYEPNNPNSYNIPKLKGNLSRAVRNQGVLAYRYTERFDAQTLQENDSIRQQDKVQYQQQDLTNPKILRARGIKVVASGFPDLFPVHSQVSGQLLDYWRSSWERNSTERRSQSELQAVRVINQARAQAQRDMAHTLAQILQSSRSDEALALRVFQALESIAINTDNRQFLPRDTMFMLRSFKRWFLPEGGSDDEGDLGDEYQLPGDDTPYLEG
jgi:hypothetical protein